MNGFNLIGACVAASLMMAACTGARVNLGDQAADVAPAPSAVQREISASACGFQLLLFIPINVNDRLDRAYQVLRGQAGGDTITNVQMQENWTYAFVGTVYCTSLKATAIAG